MISIRAPVKGAIAQAIAKEHQNLNFNPRTREGCDALFLHRLLILVNFNPRTREGCDSSFCLGLDDFYELDS